MKRKEMSGSSQTAHNTPQVQKNIPERKSRGSAETSYQVSLLRPNTLKEKGSLPPWPPCPVRIPGTCKGVGSCVSPAHLTAGPLQTTFQTDRNNPDAQKKRAFLFSRRRSSPSARALVFSSLYPRQQNTSKTRMNSRPCVRGSRVV